MATRAQIRTRARTRADQDGGTFPSDAQYNDFIDDAAREVQYDLIGAGWPMASSGLSFPMATTPVAKLVDLGLTATIAFVRGVYRMDGSTLTELRRLKEEERAALLSMPSGRAEFYRVYVHASEGPIVEVLPFQAGTYLIEYIPEFTGFVNDSSVWYGPARSDELIQLKAAMKGLRKEGDDQGARELEREYGQLYESVIRMASGFDMRNPPTIRDVGEQLTQTRQSFDYDI